GTRSTRATRPAGRLRRPPGRQARHISRGCPRHRGSNTAGRQLREAPRTPWSVRTTAGTQGVARGDLRLSAAWVAAPACELSPGGGSEITCSAIRAMLRLPQLQSLRGRGGHTATFFFTLFHPFPFWPFAAVLVVVVRPQLFASRWEPCPEPH